MIPKTIHYCWLSGEPMPRETRRCMDTWRRVLPDYELKLWSKDNFDVERVPFVSEACKMRKWAFAADYIRMYALYHDGGIYLDTDVRVLKTFDPLLNHRFMSAVEFHQTQADRDGAWLMLDEKGHRVRDGYVSGIMIQAAVMGAEAGHPFVKDVLEWYENNRFVDADGQLFTTVLAPMIYARVAERYGFLYKDEDQELQEGIQIYASNMIAGNKHELTERTRAVHLCAHSWHPTLIEKLKKLFS